MSQQIDTFGVYVRTRLDEWGREFALHRDCEYLGHRSKDMLQVLIEHRGELPARPTGFKPLEIKPSALEIEHIVSDMARFNLVRATVMRGYYCGIGRRGGERLEIANELMRRMGQRPVSRPKYFAEHELGVAEVRGVLLGLARAA